MKNFIRKIENFKCEHCGAEMRGDGYTDHCSECLWGKHVDSEIPGDRASECRALMEPIRVLYEKGEYRIVYKCTGCSHKFEVKAANGDNREKLIELVNN
jgi:DNA-directed RNA polymerase subunit RPC12/RpoP